MNTYEQKNKKTKQLKLKQATLIPQPKLYFMAIWSCWFPHFFLSLQRLHCIQSQINSQTKGNKACNRGENSISQLSLFYKMIWFLRLNISVYSEDEQWRQWGQIPREVQEIPACSSSGPAGALPNLLAFHKPSVALTHKALTPPNGHKNML